MKNDLFINGVDAYERYGISLEPTAVSALMTPPPMKDIVGNASRLEHGKRVVNNTPRYADRDVTLSIHIVARTENDFLAKYKLFCDEVLATGQLEIATRYEPDKLYRFNYLSCTQFAEYRMEMALFSLKLNEPNPDDRKLGFHTGDDKKPIDWEDEE